MKLQNVHILGKSAGAGIAIHIMDKSDIYTGLFLVVPSSPLNVQLLRELPKDRLK
jgi:alpha-beta hydrolase superfamily lysophospholipase